MKKLSISILMAMAGSGSLGASGVFADTFSPSAEETASETPELAQPRTFLLHKLASHHLALWKHYCSFHPAHFFCDQVVTQPAPQPPAQTPKPPVEQPPVDQPDDSQKNPIPLPPNPGPDEPWPTVIAVDGKDYPICGSSKFDADKDGWGWQDNQTCIVYHMPCSSASLDQDGDGWGWENGESCSVWK